MRIYTKESPEPLRRGQEPPWESFFCVLPRKIESTRHAKVEKPFWAFFERVERKWIRFENPMPYSMGMYTYRPVQKS